MSRRSAMRSGRSSPPRIARTGSSPGPRRRQATTPLAEATITPKIHGRSGQGRGKLSDSQRVVSGEPTAAPSSPAWAQEIRIGSAIRPSRWHRQRVLSLSAGHGGGEPRAFRAKGRASSARPRGGSIMPIFRRVKIQSTVETPALLLPEEEIAGKLDALKERLQQLELSIVSLQSSEPTTTAPSEASDEDPWSVGGRPTE